MAFCKVLEATGAGAGDGALRHNRLSGIFSCCSDVIVQDAQRTAGDGDPGAPRPSRSSGGDKWKHFNTEDMSALATGAPIDICVVRGAPLLFG